MRKSRIRTVSFDCGGTLYYEIKEDYVVHQEVLGELGYDVDSGRVREALKNARSWWNQKKARTGAIWGEDAWADMLKRLCSNLRLPNSSELAIKLCDLWPHRAALQAYNDAEPALKALKQRRIGIIAISNVSLKKNLQTYLNRVGLASYFEILVASGSIGYEKPNPEIFKIASKLSNSPLKMMMHIGDKYEEDYLAAEAVGMKAILLDRKEVHTDKTGRKIFKLTELLAYLNEE